MPNPFSETPPPAFFEYWGREIARLADSPFSAPDPSLMPASREDIRYEIRAFMDLLRMAPTAQRTKPLSGKAFKSLVLGHEDFQKLAAMSPAAIKEWAVQMAARALPPQPEL